MINCLLLKVINELQGYREKHQWVATQLPLSQTAADFWQLNIEREIKLIVQLEKSQVYIVLLVYCSQA